MLVHPTVQKSLLKQPFETWRFFSPEKLLENIFAVQSLVQIIRANITFIVSANTLPQVLETFFKSQEKPVRYFSCEDIDEVDAVKQAWKNSGSGELSVPIIIFNNPNVLKKNIGELIKKGVRNFTVENMVGLRRILSESSKPTELTIFTHLITSEEISQSGRLPALGAEKEDAKELIKSARDAGCNSSIVIQTGFHHNNEAKIIGAMSQEIEVARQMKVAHLNMGGEIPVPYFYGADFNMEKFLKKITDSLRVKLAELLGNNGKLFFEVGRMLTATTVNMATPVLSVQTQNGVIRAHIAESIFGSLREVITEKRELFVSLLRKTDEGIKDISRPQSVTRLMVAGITCDSGDMFHVNIAGKVEQGDWLWMENMGAYSTSNTTFNDIPEPNFKIL